MIGYTVDDIMKVVTYYLDGYPRKHVEELYAGREALTPREITELDIPLPDRIWILSELLDWLSLHRTSKIARMIALDNSDSWHCTDIMWHYLVTGDTTIKNTTWPVASYAASGAVWYAVNSAIIWDANVELERYLGWLVRAWEVRT
jgi:hypothetical protein